MGSKFFLPMIYPPAPWTLQGYGLQTLQLVDCKLARLFVPCELEIVSFIPGKTLGSVYLSAYQAGSFLEYNEMIVAPALVRYQDKVGAWISHIYVDNPTSVAGGREIWGLPKEMAEFTWTNQGVVVEQNGIKLCQLNSKNCGLLPSIKSNFSGNGFGKIAENFLYFNTNFQATISLVQAKLNLLLESPFFKLGLDKPLVTMNLQNLHIVAGKPEILTNKELANI